MLVAAILSTVLVANPAEPEPAPAALTYTKDIAPIFRESCEECHRSGEPAPMSLRTYDEIRPWVRSIKRYVEKREMPPWHADPKFGKFKNDPRLSDEEVKKIVSWVDAGAPKGDPKHLPKPRKFTKGWRIGKPDQVFVMPKAMKIPAEGEVPYRYITIPTGFKEDKWITALEARPGNPEVVHHIIVFVRQKGQRGIWAGHLGGMAPGEGPDIYPLGAGKLVKAGATLLLQMHYTPSGKATTDRSMVGIKFSDKPLRQVHTQAAMNPGLWIPPNAENHEIKSRFKFRGQSTLLGVMPHMHVRGKDFRYELTYPDGKKETLLSVPKWDFNWQHYYIFEKPLLVPKGATLECTAHFDNSKKNKFNPNPDQLVRWGDQTWEEMMIGFISYVDGEPGSLAKLESPLKEKSESEEKPEKSGD